MSFNEFVDLTCHNFILISFTRRMRASLCIRHGRVPRTWDVSMRFRMRLDTDSELMETLQDRGGTGGPGWGWSNLAKMHPEWIQNASKCCNAHAAHTAHSLQFDQGSLPLRDLPEPPWSDVSDVPLDSECNSTRHSISVSLRISISLLQKWDFKEK